MGDSTKVFFTHRVSGTPDQDPMEKWYDCVRGNLEKYSIDVSLKKKKKKADREGLSPDTIYYGEMESLESANCLVADVTYPSLGVGYEISYAQNKGYKVLCLFHKSSERDVENLSPMIRGATGPKFYVESYENEEELKQILVSHLV